MTKHTPSPWVIETDDHDNRIYISHFKTVCNETTVCNVNLFSTKDEQKANANIISAAPKLLEALERVKELSDAGKIFLGAIRQQEVNSAIAKAKGQS